MRTSIAALLLAFFVAVWLTPIARTWAIRLNLVDSPSEGRRVNTEPIPRLGGIAIAIAFTVPFAALTVYESGVSRYVFADARRVAVFFVGAFAALAIGLVDDLYRPPAKVRLLALIALATFTWFGGFGFTRLGLPGMEQFDLGFWSFPATVVWIVGVMVAFDIIDGLDGLAAGIGLIATLTMFVMAFLDGNGLWMTWTGALAGALLGFLFFNFNPASIFMGDSGSNFLGYVIAVVALREATKEQTAFALLVPGLALGIPILDAALSVLRRALMRISVFRGDREHLHHRFLDLGLSHRNTVLVLWGLTAALCVSGLSLLMGVHAVNLAASVVISGVVFGIALTTGYLRPGDLRRMWQRGTDIAAKERSLVEQCDRIAAELPASAGRDERARIAMEQLLASGLVTGIRYDVTGAGSRTAGVCDPAAKGVRATVPIEVAEFTILWKGRSLAPTKSEIEALEKLVERIRSATP